MKRKILPNLILVVFTTLTLAAQELPEPWKQQDIGTAQVGNMAKLAGTVKHPADKDVILRRMRPDGSGQADIIAFNGSQGTINVNSWSPDSKHFAFVMYDLSAK